MMISPPKQLKWKEFEATILYRFEALEKAGIATAGRYGVQGVFRAKQGSSIPEWQPIKSNPDIEGVTDDSWHFVFDAKVCGSASLALHDKIVAKRQIKFMMRRSRFQTTCMFVIHWNERELSSRVVVPATYAFPVHFEHPFWVAFERGEVKSISRDYCEKYAVPVPWNIFHGQRNESPDVLFAVNVLREVTDHAISGDPLPVAVEEPPITRSSAERIKKKKPAVVVPQSAKKDTWQSLLENEELKPNDNRHEQQSKGTPKPPAQSKGKPAETNGSADQRQHPF